MALNYGRSSRHIVFGTTSKGPTGPQGPKGAKGDTGSVGPVGGISSISSNLSMNSNKIVGLGAPSDDTDASTKKYVDSKVLTRIGHDGSTPMSADLDMGDNKIVNVGDPASGTDACTKLYVDQEAAVVKLAADAYTMLEVGKKVSLDGSTAMTGNLNMGSNMISKLAHPGSGDDAANKAYVDNKVNAGFVNGNNYTNGLIGGVLDLGGSRVMTGDLDVGGSKVVAVGAPTAGTDSSNKKYVDDEVAKTKLASDGFTLLEVGKRVNLDGSTAMTGNLDVGGNKIVSLGVPTADTYASTKKYVDDNISSSTSLHIGSGLNMNFKKIGNLGAPTSTQDATTKEYVDKIAATKLNFDGSWAMTGNLSMGGNRVVGTGAGDTDASTKKYVNDTSTSAQVTASHNLAAMGARKVSVDGTSVMSGGLNMNSNGIANLSDSSNDGDATNKKYVDSKSGSGGITDTSKFVTIDKSGYKVTYAGGTYKTFSYTTSGYYKPYNGGYGSDLTITEGNKVRVPVVGEMKSLHIEQDPDSSGVAEIRITTAMPNSYWTAAKTQGVVFAAKHGHPTSQLPSMWIEQASSEITQDVKLMGVIGGNSIYLSRVIYDASITPLTITVSFKYVGVSRMVLDLYPGFEFDGINQAKYYSSNLTNSLYYPTHPQFDHHKFIDSTVGDVLVAGVQNPDGFLTVDKLLITKGNIDASPSSWFHTETGKSFVTDLPFGAVGRGVNTFTFHRMTLPPAKKVTLMVMSVDGNTVLEDLMVFELGTKFYVGGGSSTTGKLTDIRKSDALVRCEGVMHLNKDIVVSLPNLCIGFEMYMRQTNLLGSDELNKKITMLVRVFSG